AHLTTCPLDPIPTQLLRSPSSSILRSLTHIFNLSLSTGASPPPPKASLLTDNNLLHPPLSFPPLASIQCPPPLSVIPSTGLHSVSSTPLSVNPSTGLHSVSSTPLCHSLHWPPP
ncbi:unnamed protein product, partial [Staurois parvus]